MVINFDKYKTDGWGLSELAFKKIIEIIDNIDNTTISIIEFGSGKSTEFLVDLDKADELYRAKRAVAHAQA